MRGSWDVCSVFCVGECAHPMSELRDPIVILSTRQARVWLTVMECIGDSPAGPQISNEPPGPKSSKHDGNWTLRYDL